MLRNIIFKSVSVSTKRPLLATTQHVTAARHQSTDVKDDLVVNKENQILTIRFNRPQKFNAITREMYTTLTETLVKANTDDSIKLIVLTGTGDYYSSGNDLSNFTGAAKHPEGLKAGLAESGRILFNFVESFVNLKKFIIAAVNGPAVGISVTTLPLCDYVVASDKSTFHTPFTALGQCPEACSSLTFPSLLGGIRANELLMLNMTWDAAKAKNYGLVAEVVENDKFAGYLDKFTNKIVSSCYPNSLMASKSLVRSPELKKRLTEANRQECGAIVDLWSGEECLDAVQKFFKRPKN